MTKTAKSSDTMLTQFISEVGVRQMILDYVGDDIVLDFKVGLYEQLMKENSASKSTCIDLSSNFAVPASLIAGRPDWIDIEALSNNMTIMPDVFDKYIARYGTSGINWISLSRNNNMTPAFFNKYIGDINVLRRKDFWYYVSVNRGMTPAFFEAHLDKVNWYWLSKNGMDYAGVTQFEVVQFFDKHCESINWETVVENTGLPESFFDKHIDDKIWKAGDYGRIPYPKIAAGGLAQHPNLSVDFFVKHVDKFLPSELARNEKLPLRFFVWLIKYKPNRCTDDFWSTLAYRNMTQYAKVDQKDEVSLSKFFDFYITHGLVIGDVWSELSENQSIDAWFFAKYMDRVNWPDLCKSKRTTPELFDSYIAVYGKDGNTKRNNGQLDWYNLSSNPAMTPQFFEKYADKVDWPRLSGNSMILGSDKAKVVSFFEKHITLIHWCRMASNISIPAWFFEKYMSVIANSPHSFAGECDHDNFWRQISHSTVMPIEFFEKYLDKLNISNILSNSSIPRQYKLRAIKAALL